MGLSTDLQLAFALAAASICVPAVQPLSGPEFRIYEGHLQDGERGTEKPEGLPSGFSARTKFLEFFREDRDGFPIDFDLPGWILQHGSAAGCPCASWVCPFGAEFLKDTQIAPKDHQANIEGVHHGAEMARGGVSIPIDVLDRYTFQ